MCCNFYGAVKGQHPFKLWYINELQLAPKGLVDYSEDQKEAFQYKCWKVVPKVIRVITWEELNFSTLNLFNFSNVP